MAWLIQNQKINATQRISNAIIADDAIMVQALLEYYQMEHCSDNVALVMEYAMMMGTQKMIELCCWYKNPFQLQIRPPVYHKTKDVFTKACDSQYRCSPSDSERNQLDVFHIFWALEQDLRHLLQNRFPNTLTAIIMDYCSSFGWSPLNQSHGGSSSFLFVYFICILQS